MRTAATRTITVVTDRTGTIVGAAEGTDMAARFRARATASRRLAPGTRTVAAERAVAALPTREVVWTGALPV